MAVIETKNDSIKNILHITCNPTEWIYAPEEVYTESDASIERKLQVIFPFNRQWNAEEQDGSYENRHLTHRFPLVVYMPGAAWYRQEMYNSIPVYSKLAEKGVIFAGVQVRESTLAHYPVPVQDVKTAIRYLIKHADKFRIDTNRIYVMGNSSGGHLALMTAYSWANHDVESESYQNIDYTIKGVIAECSPTDMRLLGGAPSLSLMGIDSLDSDPEKVLKASCRYYVKPASEVLLPPTLLFHGTQDSIVSIEHSRRLYQLLTENRQKVTYNELEGTDHCTMEFWSDEILNRMIDFINRT